jgi:Formyltetrahydrofolate hydrolase
MSIEKYVLTLSCPNRPGIVAKISSLLFSYGGNITEAHQFDDAGTGKFFMRVVFSLPDGQQIDPVLDEFAAIAEDMPWTGTCTPPPNASGC